ncbi:MAG: hypothetical protein Q7J31_05860 [Syntrophales bacterium]|nr:hypothetical protein [Syntrophales bacterium]
MGFSFSGIREELDSKELGKLYRRLQADCRYLAPFADWKAIVAFLHEKKRAYRQKDRILWRLIQYYRQGGDCERLGAVFLSAFAPAIVNLCDHGRKQCPHFGDDDLFHEVCTMFLRILREMKIVSDKGAVRIVGRLRNDVQAMLDEKCRDREWMPTGVIDFFGSHPDALESDSPDDFTEIMKTMDILEVSDARGLLDLLARRRVIDWEEKTILDATLIAGKTLKDVSQPGEYERLKSRRKNALKAIRVYLLRILKKEVS